VKILRAEVEATAAAPAGFPTGDVSEIAFLGRSNVGKSTLLNRLTARRKLAYTSRTPGKTRLVHFYRVERPHSTVRLVDLPGYGFARVSKQERQRWQTLVEGYLETRPELALLLFDLRRDPSDDEALLLQWLDQREIESFVVLTKVDKLKPMRRAQRVRQLQAAFDRPCIQNASSDALWKAIDARL
jgi:GTP-binding protein